MSNERSSVGAGARSVAACDPWPSAGLLGLRPIAVIVNSEARMRGRNLSVATVRTFGQRPVTAVALIGLVATLVSYCFLGRDAADPGDDDLRVVLEPLPATDNAAYWLGRLHATWPLSAADDTALTRWLDRDGVSRAVGWDGVRAAEILARLAPARALLDRALGCSRAQADSLDPAALVSDRRAGWS